MNQKHSTASRSLSSRRGRDWLKNTDKPISSQNSAGQNNAPIEMVSIPDVSVPSPAPAAGVKPSTNATKAHLDQLLADATEQRLADVQTAHGHAPPAAVKVPESQASDSQAAMAAAQPMAQTTDDVSVDAGINDLVTAIIERFPLGNPTVLLFVGSQANDHTHQTCNHVAAQLAEMKIGRILLVDGDAENQSLSKFRQLPNETGLVEVIKSKQSWRSVVQNDSDDGVYFVPAGAEPLGIVGELQKAQLRSAVTEMKQEFQFVCVAGGDALEAESQIWNSVCDGSYLLVSMKTSDETRAKSAVTELQSSGARLIGCVVTDVADDNR